MKITEITLNSDTTFKSIVANIFAHSIRIREMSTNPVGLQVQWPDDTFTNTFQHQAGESIVKSGNAIHGALGMPAQAKGVAATTYCKLRATDNSAAKIELTEFLYGEDVNI